MKLIKSLVIALCVGFTSHSLMAQEGGDENQNTFHVSPIQYYGERITPDNAMKPAQFLKSMDGKDSMDVKLEAKIITCCKKKGCWMDIDLENGTTMKVRFKDYEFFVPKDADGSTTIIQGRAKKEVVDVATLRHYAQDAGKTEDEINAIKEPQETFTFMAVGVIIKK